MKSNIKSPIQLLDYFFVLRPMLFFPGWSTLMAGFFIEQNNKLVLSVAEIQTINLMLLIELLFIFASAMGMSFLLNQLQDKESDRNNQKLFIISEDHIRKRAVIVESVILGSIATIGGFAQSLQIGILILSFIVLTAFLYNFRPLSLKDRPFGSLLANAFMGFIAFAIGWSAQRDWALDLFYDSLPYVFFNTALYLFTTLPDIKGDRVIKKNTLAVSYGLKRVLYLALMFYIVSLAAALVLSDRLALFFLVFSAPFYVITLRNTDVQSAVRTTKFGILFFAIAVCLKLPYYLFLMVVLFCITRWYFQARFNFNYPNFKGS